MKLIKMTDLNGLLQAEIVPKYAVLIMDNPNDEDIVRVNKMIISKWSESGLLRIKEKAWKMVRRGYF